jgi:membrane-associated phospholipid phosphatase
VPAYIFAGYVASSRLHENRHFASDVVFGAAVGTIAGRTVTRHGRDKFEFSVTPSPSGFSAHASWK